MNVGAVAALRNIKDAIAVARHVLENTKHTLLAGDQAAEFAVMMGFNKESLATEQSKKMWKNWRRQECQPNFWTVNKLHCNHFIVKYKVLLSFLECRTRCNKVMRPISTAKYKFDQCPLVKQF